MQRSATRAPRRSRLGVDLSILMVVGVMLVAALGAGGAALYQRFYSPTAFVEDYLSLLASGRAADALRMPGVAVDRDLLTASGIDPTASEALLRRTALAPLTDVEVVSAQRQDDTTRVTVEYEAGGHPGSTTFDVQQDGWLGVVPRWTFQHSPLAAVKLLLLGADEFRVNGFDLQRGQISVDGGSADPTDPVSMLVFTPGVYSITVDTAISQSPGVSILADSPLTSTQVDVQAHATQRFIDIVQDRVEEFLTGCTTQEVLQPTACPFGFEVRNRLASAPTWSIAEQPHIDVAPDGPNWEIPPTDAVAHIDVDVQSFFDGSVQHVSEDVPFQVDGTISILADGSASIRVGAPVPDE